MAPSAAPPSHGCTIDAPPRKPAVTPRPNTASAQLLAIDGRDQDNDLGATNVPQTFINAAKPHNGNHIPTESANALIADVIEIIALPQGA